ncbi:hypothetical protein PYQ42_000665 [Escherichia coli]|nr:hypothetical protein [Escherichia coli]
MRPDLNILPGDSGCSVWFYNGMSQPRLLAGSIAGLLTDVTITSNYRGDVTSEIHDVQRSRMMNVKSVTEVDDAVVARVSDVLEFAFPVVQKSF